MALFLGEDGDGELDEDGEDVGEEEYEETEPKIVENEGEGEAEEPIAGADEFFSGENV